MTVLTAIGSVFGCFGLIGAVTFLLLALYQWYVIPRGRARSGLLTIITGIAFAVMMLAIIASIASFILNVAQSGPGTAVANTANYSAREAAIAARGINNAATVVAVPMPPAGTPVPVGKTDLEILQDFKGSMSINGGNSCDQSLGILDLVEPNSTPLTMVRHPLPNRPGAPQQYSQYCLYNPKYSGVNIPYEYIDTTGAIHRDILKPGDFCRTIISFQIPRIYQDHP